MFHVFILSILSLLTPINDSFGGKEHDPQEQAITAHFPKKKQPYLELVMPNGTKVLFQKNKKGKRFDLASKNRGFVSARANVDKIKIYWKKKADSFHVIFGDGSKRNYCKAKGNLYQVLDEIDPSGNHINYVYNKKGKLVRSITYSPDYSQFLKEEQFSKKPESAEKNVEYVWDKDKRLIKIKRRDSRNIMVMKEQFEWAKEGALLSQTLFDERNKSLFTRRFTYDEKGNIIKDQPPNVSDESNQVKCDGNCDYDFFKRIRKITYPAIFDEKGKRIVPVKRYEYKQLGLKKIETDENGFKKVTKYDTFGKVVQEILQDGTSRTFQYDKEGKKTTSIYDAMGKLYKNVSPNFFDQKPAAQKNYPESEKSFDARGNLSSIKIRSPSGKLVTHKEFFYDAVGNVVLIRDHAKKVTQTKMYYGPNRRLEKVVENAGTSKEKSTEHRYNMMGQRASTLLPDKKKIEYRYDNQNRCTEQIFFNKKGKEKKRKKM